MQDVIRLVGANQAVELFGIKLVGVNAENDKKLLFTLAFIALLFLLSFLLRTLVRYGRQGRGYVRIKFWTRQGIGLLTAMILLLGVTSIWFDDPTRLATALGLVTAGLAFALQKTIMAIAGRYSRCGEESMVVAMVFIMPWEGGKRWLSCWPLL